MNTRNHNIFYSAVLAGMVMTTGTGIAQDVRYSSKTWLRPTTKPALVQVQPIFEVSMAATSSKPWMYHGIEFQIALWPQSTSATENGVSAEMKLDSQPPMDFASYSSKPWLHPSRQ